MSQYIHNRLRVLYANLLKMGITDYVEERDFKLILIKKNCDRIWNEARTKTHFVDPEIFLAIFLSILYVRHHDRFLGVLDEILMGFSEWKRGDLDKEKIREGLREIGYSSLSTRTMKFFKEKIQAKKKKREEPIIMTPTAHLVDTASNMPPEIAESLERFKKDHPDAKKVGFIMMKFGKTRAHDRIVKGIKETLASYGLEGVRSDDKQYHDDLFPNVLTYVYGCGFGIAVFERIEAELFNPNVSLEVGYMMALRKEVCLLKDETLKTLHADLLGKLYKPFDPQDPEKTIPDVLSKWLSDKEITRRASS